MDGGWRRDEAMSYLGVVPREVLLPTGPPGGLGKVPRAVFISAVPPGRAKASVYRSRCWQPTGHAHKSVDACARDEGDGQGDKADMSAFSKENGAEGDGAEVDRNAGVRPAATAGIGRGGAKR